MNQKRSPGFFANGFDSVVDQARGHHVTFLESRSGQRGRVHRSERVRGELVEADGDLLPEAAADAEREQAVGAKIERERREILVEPMDAGGPPILGERDPSLAELACGDVPDRVHRRRVERPVVREDQHGIGALLGERGNSSEQDCGAQGE